MEKKYDVAIVGVGVGANYGSVLTYYSLYKAIESLGKVPYLIAQIGSEDHAPKLKDTHALRFAKKHYNLSETYSRFDVSKLNDLADTFILGSDQVFNYGVSKGFGKAFYLDFVNDENQKISYASSFGHAIDFAPADEVEVISGLFKRFNAISVREDSGVTLAKEVYGVPATQVSEPVFLLEHEAYEELANQSELDVSKPYMLAYVLDPTPEKKKAMEHLAKKLNLEIRMVLDGFPNLFESNLRKTQMEDSVERDVETYDFLKLYINSSYVFTDSFHGTSFALKFQKPFATIGNKRRGMARFQSLFRLVGNESRFTVDPLSVVKNDAPFLANVDFDKVTSIIEKHVEFSRAWLKSALDIDAVETIGQNEPVSKFNFISNADSWVVKHTSLHTSLRVKNISDSVRGEFVYCDILDKRELVQGKSYQLTIDWDIFTSSDFVNLHLRNGKTNKFIPIGSVELLRGANSNRKDVISFVAKDVGYTQLMLGAVHFMGIDAGVNIRSIDVLEINKKDVDRKPLKVANRSKEFSRIDGDRFNTYYAEGRVPKGKFNARTLLMFYAHGLEKGLSRTSDFRPRFGIKSIEKLSGLMNNWLASGESRYDQFFQVAVSVMRNYFNRHNELNVSVDDYISLFDEKVQENINSSDLTIGGAIKASSEREDLFLVDQSRSFTDVMFGRRSVRNFTSQHVTDDLIENAVRLAIQSPSVCNRQPVRVHCFDDQKLMKEALKIQGGWNGYIPPPKLLLITSNLSGYVGAVERNQAFIDGGLFMMGLLLGLENQGLGSCSLNTAMSPQKEDSIRRRMGVSESEVFISFVAVGNYDKDVLVPRSKRLDVEEILITKH